jgi:hypothetical protein
MARDTWLLLALLAGASARAYGDDPPRPNSFPTANELFHRVLADPRQSQTSALYQRLQGMNVAELALGNTWGIHRWRVGSRGLSIQWDVDGMAYSRFKLSGGINEFQTVDFFANLPVELRDKAFSGRFTLFHESSHLGDDYIRATGLRGYRYSFEGVRQLLSYEPTETFRVYGGGSYLIHRIPAAYRPGMVQGGIELTSHALRTTRPEAKAYLAADLKSIEAVGWNVNSNTACGIRFGYDGVGHILRIFIGHFEGHSEFAQFYASRESRNYVGTALEF